MNYATGLYNHIGSIVTTQDNGQPVSLSITSFQDGGVTVDASQGGQEQTGGTVAFADEYHTNSNYIVTSALASTTDPSGNALGMFAASLQSTDASPLGGTTTGSVAWSYQVNDSALASVQDGQTVFETYVVTIDDGLGTGNTIGEPITVAITRPNDQTSVTTVGSNGQIVADANHPTETVGGTIAFTDGDKLDTHTASFAFDPTHSDQATPLGTFAINLATDTTGSGTGGEVAWTYTAPDSVLSSLTDGQVVHETYIVSVSDGHGGVQTESVLVTVSRPNLLSIANSTAAPVVVTQGQNPGSTDTSSGSDAFSDGDLQNTHQVSEAFQGADNPLNS